MKLTEICEAKFQGTKYDKFFVEEFVKKYKVPADLEAVIEKISSASDPIYELETIINARKDE